MCRFAEQKLLMSKQEKDIEATMTKYAQELKDGEADFLVSHLPFSSTTDD